ncbi:hypothetical protein BDW42DRAFT_195937 [Aspergillus taichungensis]|uniref:Rhodopsin family protein n=1 Tax=Aspergillus taichungensis TaxID=482145 RepID=A0A2J5HME6_9EURO|nr:hypothetical protein BDW42DRAFT_195937 [Aspergillus taichungensis]
MAICITFGTHEFSSMLEGYEQVRAYCYNCQHYNGHCVTRWPWFTICFIPAIPLSMGKYKEVRCYTCNFTQDLKDRPDITPETRPPQGFPGGPGPAPPGFYGNYPQYAQPPPPQQQQQGPPVASGAGAPGQGQGYGYK